MISIISAISKNNCIGKNGQIPWDLPEDMKHVRELTTGHVIIMGKNTWESIPEKFRPLPNRKNIVICDKAGYAVPESVETYATIQQALDAHPNEEIFGFGGGGIYREMINIAETLYITHVDKEIENCDVYFPEIDPSLWKETAREDHTGFSFVTYTRKSDSNAQHQH